MHMWGKGGIKESQEIYVCMGSIYIFQAKQKFYRASELLKTVKIF